MIYAGAQDIRAELSTKSERNKHQKEPGWKTRLEKKLKERRQDLSRLDEISSGRYECHQYLLRKYHFDKQNEKQYEYMKDSSRMQWE